MNNSRRKEIKSNLADLSDFRTLLENLNSNSPLDEEKIEELTGSVSSISENIEWLRDEEQDAYDNMPEGLQYSDRGDIMMDAISELDNCFYEIEDCISFIENSNILGAIEKVKSAIQCGYNAV